MTKRKTKAKPLSKAQTEIARQAFNSAADFHRGIYEPVVLYGLCFESIIRHLTPKERAGLSKQTRANLNGTGAAMFDALRRSLDIKSAEVVVNGQVVEKLRVWPDADCARAYANVVDWLDNQKDHPWHDTSNPSDEAEDATAARWFEHSKG